MKETITSQLTRLDTDRMKGYRELLDFYHGRQWEGRERRSERRLTFNYAKVFVEKITSYLMAGIGFAVEPVEKSDEAGARAIRAEQALSKVYEDNQLEQLDFETEVDCAVLGDACYKVIWDAVEKTVRVTAPDVQGIYAWFPGDDTSRVWRVASKYRLSDEEVERLAERNAGPRHRLDRGGRKLLEVFQRLRLHLVFDRGKRGERHQRAAARPG